MRCRTIAVFSPNIKEASRYQLMPVQSRRVGFRVSQEFDELLGKISKKSKQKKSSLFRQALHEFVKKYHSDI